MNSVTIVGRVGIKPEIKYFESGKGKATFTMAVSRWDSKSQSEVTDWFNIEAWEKSAEIAANYVNKGTLVLVEGRLRIDKYNSKDGTEKDWNTIVVNRIRLLGKKSEQ